jgi:hypothetical protein
VTPRVVAGAAVLLTLLAAWALLASRPAGGIVTSPPPGRSAPPPVLRATPLPLPVRDPFRYAEATRPSPQAAPAAPLAPSPAPTPPPPAPTPAPVRLVGLIRRGGQLRAVLSLGGEMVVLGRNEEAAGWRVLRLDEDAGVVLQGPGGAELTLAPPAR